MEIVRSLSQMGHAQRQIANIKIRQPLAKLTLNLNSPLNENLLSIIAAEVNVKDLEINLVKENPSVILDTKLTPELIDEGEYRDLIRNIQVLRKEQQLKLTDRINIIAPDWPITFEKQILEKTLADSIQKGNSLSINKAR